MTTVDERYGVVVGYDGSDGSVQALDWSIEEARARRAPLTLCHAWQIPYPGLVPPPSEEIRKAAGTVLEEGAEYAGKAAPDLEVRRLLVCGAPLQVLYEVGPAAELVVTGSRGRGGIAQLLLGSVSGQLAAHARFPVVVVRGSMEAPPEYYPGRVVAGLDGSAAAARAVAFAFDEAHLHGVPLTVVCAWPRAAAQAGEGTPFVDAAGLRAMGEARFAELLGPLRTRYPDVRVEERFTDGRPEELLLEAAETARLVVVGARGLGGVRGVLLGSVSQAVLHHAPCPVAVLHAPPT